MRISLVAGLLLSVSLASCGSYDDGDSDGTTPPDGNENSGLGGDEGDNNSGTGASVAGLWNFSDIIATEYQLWTDDGSITVYEYQGDGEGNGQNCFLIDELTFTREGDQFTFGSLVQTITRDNNTLTIDGVGIPLATDVVQEDLNECI